MRSGTRRAGCGRDLISIYVEASCRSRKPGPRLTESLYVLVCRTAAVGWMKMNESGHSGPRDSGRACMSLSRARRPPGPRPRPRPHAPLQGPRPRPQDPEETLAALGCGTSTVARTFSWAPLVVRWPGPGSLLRSLGTPASPAFVLAAGPDPRLRGPRKRNRLCTLWHTSLTLSLQLSSCSVRVSLVLSSAMAALACLSSAAGGLAWLC
jgi:hypothetical protein